MDNRNNGRHDLPIYLIEDDEAVRRGCEQTIQLADMVVRSFTSA